MLSNKYKSIYTTHPLLFLMENIKLDWIPAKIWRVNKAIIPTLVLFSFTMPNSSFEETALRLKSYKIQLAVLLFLVVLDQLVNPSVWNLQNTLAYRMKEKLWYLPFCSVLLTNFGPWLEMALFSKKSLHNIEKHS